MRILAMQTESTGMVWIHPAARRVIVRCPILHGQEYSADTRAVGVTIFCGVRESERAEWFRRDGSRGGVSASMEA